MTAQFLTLATGDRLVVLAEADYGALARAAEDNADREAIAEFRRALAAGEEELVPDAVVGRLLDGENPVRVWREHRGLTALALAEKAGITQPYLSQIETGKREGTLDTYRKLAGALSISLDDLAG